MMEFLPSLFRSYNRPAGFASLARNNFSTKETRILIGGITDEGMVCRKDYGNVKEDQINSSHTAHI